MSIQSPAQWHARLDGYVWTRQTAGQSEAAVFRLDRDGDPSLFVKTEPASSLAELPAEGARLRWLAGHAIPCPQLLGEVQAAERHWLLMSAVPGRDLASSPELAPEQIVEIAAGALHRLHELDARRCPFDHTLDRQLARARKRVENGLVNEEDFDEERLGQTAAGLFEELVRQRPPDEDLVVTHGDATFSNLIAHGGRFSGFIDCTRLGVADRHQDLALIIRDICHDLGDEWVAPFLRHYGRDADPERLAFFQLLDEFF